MAKLPMQIQRKSLLKLLVAVLVLVGVAALARSAPYNRLSRADAVKVYRSSTAIPARPGAIVFEALVFPDGLLSPVLRGRVDAAVTLFKAGKVAKILMTGDNGTANSDEVTPMQTYTVSCGVLATRIVRDYAGFRTFDSCYRAPHIFGVTGAILVT